MTWIVVYKDKICGGAMAYRCKEARTETEAREEFLRRSQGYDGWEIVRVEEVQS